MVARNLATTLFMKYKTRDPFVIAHAIGYQIIFTHLLDIRGFYQHIKRCHIIYIDDSLDEHQARFVCAHELGHSLLHKGMNRIFMDTRTHMISSRFETEADRFAVDLIFDDNDLQLYADSSIETVSRCLGISYELATYRMQSLKK